jgi:hypothetical protein
LLGSLPAGNLGGRLTRTRQTARSDLTHITAFLLKNRLIVNETDYLKQGQSTPGAPGNQGGKSPPKEKADVNWQEKFDGTIKWSLAAHGNLEPLSSFL